MIIPRKVPGRNLASSDIPSSPSKCNLQPCRWPHSLASPRYSAVRLMSEMLRDSTEAMKQSLAGGLQLTSSEMIENTKYHTMIHEKKDISEQSTHSNILRRKSCQIILRKVAITSQTREIMRQDCFYSAAISNGFEDSQISSDRQILYMHVVYRYSDQ